LANNPSDAHTWLHPEEDADLNAVPGCTVSDGGVLSCHYVDAKGDAFYLCDEYLALDLPLFFGDDCTPITLMIG